MLEEIKAMIREDGQEIKTRLYNLELVTRGICEQIKFKPSSLPLRIPVVPASSATSPALSSATSVISSTSESSGVHVPRMAMPGPSSAKPSGSGPSTVRRECLSFAKTYVPPIFFYHLQHFLFTPDGNHAQGSQVRRGPEHLHQHARHKLRLCLFKSCIICLRVPGLLRCMYTYSSSTCVS